MNRRDFLAGLAASGVALPAFTARGVAARAYPHAPYSDLNLSSDLTTNISRNVLVILRLFGGNDGLNTVVPYTDDNYYYARRTISATDVSIPAEKVLRLPNSTKLGLHPALAPLLTLYNEGKVCIVENVGYPEQDLSHFRSNDIWLSGSDTEVYEESGWLGRFLEERYPDYPRILPRDPYSIEVGRNLGRTFMGRHTHLGINIADTSFVPPRPAAANGAVSKSQLEQEYVWQMMRQSNVFLQSALRAETTAKGNRSSYPDDSWANDLAFVARMIGGGLETQVYLVNMPLWDFHLNQIHDQQEYLARLANALYPFQRDLEAFGVANRVTTITISEFGRRLTTTQSGTDHGAGSCLFVIGTNVNSGIIGGVPDCSSTDENENLKWKFDFRQVYASILRQWFDVGDREMTESLMRRQYGQLPIFRDNTIREVGSDTWQTLGIGNAFPNPASEFVSFQLHLPVPSAPSMLTIFDALGRVVAIEKIAPHQQISTLSVQHYPQGTYIATVDNTTNRFTARFRVVR